MTPTISPAYGRDYKSKAAIKADLDAGKDFVLHSFNGSTYCNRQDLLAMGARTVVVRYGNLRKVTSIKL